MVSVAKVAVRPDDAAAEKGYDMQKKRAAHTATAELMTTPLVPFNFRGDRLDVVSEDGHVRVSIRRVCEALGVSYAAQLLKLKSDPSAVVAIIATTGPDGKRYETTCIDLRSLPLWLATIHPSKVKPAVREKLIAYKRECADVLADHFLGKRGASTAMVATLPQELLQILTDQGELLRSQIEITRQQGETLGILVTDMAALKRDHAALASVVAKQAEHPERWMGHQELGDDVDREEKMRRTIGRVANYHGVKPVRIEGLLRKAFAIPSYKRLRYTQFAAATEKVLALLDRDRGDLPPARRNGPKPLSAVDPRQMPMPFTDPRRIN